MSIFLLFVWDRVLTMTDLNILSRPDWSWISEICLPLQVLTLKACAIILRHKFMSLSLWNTHMCSLLMACFCIPRCVPFVWCVFHMYLLGACGGQHTSSAVISQGLSALSFETRTLCRLELLNQTRLAGQWALSICLPLAPGVRITSAHHRVWESNSGPHACSAHEAALTQLSSVYSA